MNPELINWINQQSPWLRVATDRLLRNGQLADTDISDLVEIIKDPTRMETVIQPDETGIHPTTNVAELRLVSIGPVEGIDALNPRAPLDFGTVNLSVVYGHNGSGKSGYTRIISKACGKPYIGKLRENVFAVTPERQSCSIKYSIGGIETAIDWTPPALVDALALIDIFDSNCGRIYLENETEATFMPPELALLADLVTTCGRVESLLSSEERSLAGRLPAVPPNHVGTTAANNYGKIRHDWTEQQITTFVEWTTQHSRELDQLNATLSVADPVAAAQKRRGVKKQRTALADALGKALAQLTGPGFETSKSLFNAANDKRRIARETAEALRTVSTINGVGSDTWRAMWKAARDFATVEAYPQISFPFVDSGARCVFCQQELDTEARRRLTSFDTYVAGRIERDATTAETALRDHLKTIITRPIPEDIQTAAQAAELDDVHTSRLEEIWAELEINLRSLRERNCPESAITPSANITNLIQTLRNLATKAEEEEAAMLASAKPEARRNAVARRKELLAKKWVSEQAEAIRVEIQRLQQLHNCQQWKRQTSTTGLSRKANDMSQLLVTDAYIQRFNSELRHLGANSINVELVRTRAERGRVKHSICLRNTRVQGAQISDILSEGERRIISLAAFLADVTGRDIRSPFIFDDPISSLDQIWEERTIDRLITLSQTRQVIIFTHRLSLLGFITDKASDDPHTVHIRRETWGTGQPGELPLFAKRPDRALTDLKNARLARARSALTTDGQDAYYPLAKAICSDLRILTERIVEFVFLADIVQRHRRAVNTQGKIHKLAKIRTADCDLIDEIMTKYSCFEHSQPTEAPVELPSPEEIETDIDRLLTWHNEFKDRPIQ